MRMRDRGFTLIEVLVALFILTGAIMVIANTWSGNFMRMRKSAYINNAATLLSRKMVEIEAKYKEKALTEIPEDEAGDFGEANAQYHWAMKSKDLVLPDLSALIMAQNDGTADEMLLSMIKQVTEYLSKAIKEVKVSIFLKRVGGKELEFSAVQYFVDYSKDFAMGGGAAPAAPSTPAPTGNPGPTSNATPGTQ